MRLFFTIIISLSAFPILQCQVSNQIKDILLNKQDTVLINNSMLESKIRYINNNQKINLTDNTIQIINKDKGVVIEELYIHSRNDIVKKSSSTSDSERKLTYAYCSLVESENNPIKYFKADWIVPSPPRSNEKQIIYLYNGLVTIDSGVSHIVQPVLQWGNTPAGGGEYWAISNWYVSDTYFFHDSLIRVEPGTKLEGIIKLNLTSNSKYSYSSFFKNFPSCLQIDNLPRLVEPEIALETYFINNCDQYPSDEKVSFNSIQILTEDVSPFGVWFPSNNNIDCGGFCDIKSSNTMEGEIDIYYRTPQRNDYFEIFRIYPNPVVDFLKVISLKEVLDCKIEIFNYQGTKLQSFDSFKIINFDFYSKYYAYIDFGNYKPGIYFIKLLYEGKAHAFKVMKN